jgi:beta-galactosidase
MHPSSSGLNNGAFNGRNHEAMYNYAKSFDPGRLVQYEGNVKAFSADMFSYIYAPVERLVTPAITEGVGPEDITRSQ